MEKKFYIFPSNQITLFAPFFNSCKLPRERRNQMKSLEPHIFESVADESRQNLKATQTSAHLKSSRTTFGDAPATMNNSVSAGGIRGRYAFDAMEQKIILLTASTANKFLYC